MRQDNMDLEAGGVKFDGGKIRMDLVPMDAMMAEAAVFTYGAMKYDDWNWSKGMRPGRIVAAIQRHLAAYMAGHLTDEESGLPHLWHLKACVAMLVAGDLRGVIPDINHGSESLEGYDTALELFADMNMPADASEVEDDNGEQIADAEVDLDKDDLWQGPLRYSRELRGLWIDYEKRNSRPEERSYPDE